MLTTASVQVEVFMLPDGEYVMSQEQASRAINVHRSYMLRFCESDTLKTILGKDFTSCSLPYQDSQIGRGKSGRIKVVTLKVIPLPKICY